MLDLAADVDAPAVQVDVGRFEPEDLVRAEAPQRAHREDGRHDPERDQGHHDPVFDRRRATPVDEEAAEAAGRCGERKSKGGHRAVLRPVRGRRHSNVVRCEINGTSAGGIGYSLSRLGLIQASLWPSRAVTVPSQRRHT